jgi:ribonuclease P protein component
VALPRKNRLTTKKEIDRIFKNGRTIKGSFLFIRFLNNQKEYSKFSFVVPTKHVTLAVDRNKIRRIFSGEIVRLPLSERGYDIVAVIHKKVERSQFRELAAELREVLLKLT